MRLWISPRMCEGAVPSWYRQASDGKSRLTPAREFKNQAFKKCQGENITSLMSPSQVPNVVNQARMHPCDMLPKNLGKRTKANIMPSVPAFARVELIYLSI